MKTRRAVFLLSSMVAVMAWGIRSACGSPVLIKLHLTGESDYQKTNQLNIPVYHKFPMEVAGGDLVIAEFEKSNLNALDNAGLVYEIIDEKPWNEGYYLISESERTEKVNLSEYGKVLVTSEKLYFLKISDENARQLAGKGYFIVKVFRHPLPLEYKPPTPKLQKAYQYDPKIDSLLSLISQDSLYVWDLRLQNFKTRYSYIDSIIKARDWLYQKFASFGIDSLWLHHYYYDSDQWNVVATVPGTVRPDKVLVVGGHYDSVVYGSGTDPYTWAPGADDNGSGTVIALEMARIIAQHPLPITVMFIPFAQEEQGLIGSYYIAQYLRSRSTDILLLINSDMIGHSVDSYQNLYIYGHSTTMDFVNLMTDMAQTYTYLIPFYGGQSYGSDQHSFYQFGYHAVCAGEGDFHYAGWHTNYDVVDSLDFPYLKEVVKMCLATLVTLSQPFDYVIGDVNWDRKIDLSDVVFLINYLYKGGPYPDPWEIADVNCDKKLYISDLVYLITYLYKNGPAPPHACYY
jgi:hypothetical protein